MKAQEVPVTYAVYLISLRAALLARTGRLPAQVTPQFQTAWARETRISRLAREWRKNHNL